MFKGGVHFFFLKLLILISCIHIPYPLADLLSNFGELNPLLHDLPRYLQKNFLYIFFRPSWVKYENFNFRLKKKNQIERKKKYQTLKYLTVYSRYMKIQKNFFFLKSGTSLLEMNELNISINDLKYLPNLHIIYQKITIGQYKK